MPKPESTRKVRFACLPASTVSGPDRYNFDLVAAAMVVDCGEADAPPSKVMAPVSRLMPSQLYRAEAAESVPT